MDILGEAEILTDGEELIETEVLTDGEAEADVAGKVTAQ